MIIITSYKRFENETDEELVYRICENKDQIGSWQDVANIINELTDNDYGESTYRKKYQAFKTAGVKGITGCDIRSPIIPLLADHVLREANHYLRLLKTEGR